MFIRKNENQLIQLFNNYMIENWEISKFIYEKNKIISIGSLDSINFEILSKSILTLFKKKQFFVVGDRFEIKKNFSLYNLDKLINNINNISEYEIKKINIIDSNNIKNIQMNYWTIFLLLII